jgi:hypothetical protein
VNRQRVGRLIARLALGIAVGPPLRIFSWSTCRLRGSRPLPGA